jgi:tripartite-type tricarboxylate transporter receptor subunit TctC
VNGWFALLAPAGTPAPIVEKLHQLMTQALNDPAVRAGFERAGAEVIALPLGEAKRFQRAEIEKYRDIITKAGIERIE